MTIAQVLAGASVGTLLLFLVGCGDWEQTVASVTGYSTICVNGVEYIQFTSGASVA